MTLSSSADLVSGEIVTVNGTEFAPVTKSVGEDGAGPPPNPPFPLVGLYVAQAAQVGGVWKLGESQMWISYGAAEPEKYLSPEGNFTTGIEVNRFLDSGAVDCLKTQCVILTWQAHGPPGTPYTPIFTQTPINFARSLLVDPRRGISASEAITVNVSGANYVPALFPSGLKIAQGQANGDSYVYGPATTATMTPDPSDPTQVLLTSEGYFTAEVQVAAKQNATGGQMNCEFRSCHIIAWPADEEPSGGADGNVVAAEEIGFDFAYNPRVKLSQSRHLGAETTVSVDGSGFPAGPPGFYVAQAVWVGGTLHTAAPDRTGGASDIKFIRLGGPTADTKLNPDGTFSTSISVVRTLTLENGQKVNCVEENCHIITWRAHSDPSSETVYTYAPLSFDEEAPVVAPRINVVKRKQLRIGRSARVLRLATVACGTEACAVRRPNRVVIRVGKQKFRLALAGPKRVAAGKRAQVRLRVTGKAARALAGRKARVRFRVAVRSESGNKASTVNRVLVGAKKVGRR